LVLAREMSNRRGIILMVNNLGVLADARGDYATAALLYEEALGNAQEADDQDRLLLALENLAGIWVKQGRDGPAETGLREVLALTEPSALGSRSSTYALLARACLHQDKLPEALEAARQALSLAQENDDFEAQGAAWLSLGLVANRFKASVEVSGVRLDAATCFSESLRIYTEHQFDSGRAETLLEWARHELAAGDPAKGEAMWREARAVYAQLGALLEVERMDEERGGS
jgi:tetratricopeptide (TPR) repeat protein